MPQFTIAEREVTKSMIATFTIKGIPTREIINSIQEKMGKSISNMPYGAISKMFSCTNRRKWQ